MLVPGYISMHRSCLAEIIFGVDVSTLVHQHRTVSARSHRSFWLFVHVAVASAGSLLRRIAQPAGRKQVQQNRAALAQLAKS